MGEVDDSNRESTNWREVWRQRRPLRESLGGRALQELIELNGFDVGAGATTEAKWRKAVAGTVDLLRIIPGSSVLEVGCGAGAFLSALREICDVTVFGMDFSETLIEVAKEVLSEPNVWVGDVRDGIRDKSGLVLAGGEQVDFVVFHSVLHYLSEQEAACAVVEAMGLARKRIFLAELPDAQFEVDAESVREEALGSEVYRDKMRNLRHTYFSLDWADGVIRAVDTGKDWRVERISRTLLDTAQRDFRFSVVLERL